MRSKGANNDEHHNVFTVGKTKGHTFSSAAISKKLFISSVRNIFTDILLSISCRKETTPNHHIGIKFNFFGFYKI